MQQAFKPIEKQFFSVFFEELREAKARIDKVECRSLSVGATEEAHILAATGARNLDELIESACVVARLKRGALIQVGNLLYYANKFGCLTCTLPAAIVIGNFDGVEGPAIRWDFQSQLLKALGVTAKYNHKLYTLEKIYDYSACKVTRPGWMKP